MQRVFDIENKKDMADLWDILPVGIKKVCKNAKVNTFWSELFYQNIPSKFIDINWHDKTEITRPIQEATEEDVGKICAFWDEEKKCDDVLYGILTDTKFKTFQKDFDSCYNHCRRLTKQEIEELC